MPIVLVEDRTYADAGHTIAAKPSPKPALSLSINFMRPPQGIALLGKRLQEIVVDIGPADVYE